MIRFLEYDGGKLNKDLRNEEIADKLMASKNKDDYLLWVDIENPTPEEIKLLETDFKFHPLTIEDCLHKHQRPKVDAHKNYYFLVLSAFKGRDINRRMTHNNIYVYISGKYIVTVYFTNLNIIDDVYKRMQASASTLKRGSDFLLYEILDAITDDYFPILDNIEDKIDRIEERILKKPVKGIQDELLVLKRNIIKLRKTISPQREVINILLRHDFDLISEENHMYYMDVYDHLMRIFDMLESYQDLLAGTTDLYMTQISNKMNEIMKVLTIITTLLMPMSLIAGIYGMNFKYMPELDMKYGYFLSLGAMALFGIGGFVYFKIKKWI